MHKDMIKNHCQETFIPQWPIPQYIFNVYSINNHRQYEKVWLEVKLYSYNYLYRFTLLQFIFPDRINFKGFDLLHCS